MNTKKTLLASAIAMVLSSTSVYAAEEAETKKAEEIEVIEVIGIKGSNRAAINRKQLGGTMMDSLVAEDIGQFPDKNIAEALQRITGVQLGRDFGEGSSVSIRGMEPDLLRVETNGVSSLGMGGNRGVDFRDMASELVKSLDVIKGSEARLTEGGIGGTIQINTRKPNEFDSHYLSLNAEAQYNDLTEDTSPKYNFTGVRKINDRLGVLLNVTYTEKTPTVHALRNTEWVRFADYDGSADKTVIDPDYADIGNVADCPDKTCQQQWWDFSPRIPRYGLWNRSEERVSANAIVQFQATDNLSTHVGYTYNDRDKRAHDINLHLETHSAGRVDANSVIVDKNHNVKYFESKSATVNNRVLEFDWDQQTTILEAGFEYYNDDAFSLSGLIAHSTADQTIDSRDTQVTANGVAGVQVTLNNDGYPEWDFNTGSFKDGTPFDVNDPASYRSRARYKYAPRADETSETMAKLDAIYELDGDFFKNIRTGIQYTDHSAETESYQNDIIYNVGKKGWTMEDQLALITGNFVETPELFNGFDLGVNTGVGDSGTWMAVDNPAMLAAITDVYGQNPTVGDLELRAGNYDIDVETRAIYFQTDFESEIKGMKFWGNVGIRYVETDTDTNGDVFTDVYVDVLDENGDVVQNPDTGEDVAGEIDPDHPDAYRGRDTVSESYTDTLPSINLNLAITDNLVLYAGAAKVMARPKNSYINVNAACKIDNTRQGIADGDQYVCKKAGNPKLDPYRADQMDIALSWYPNKDTIVSAAIFTKELTSWIINPDENENVDFFNDGRLWRVTQALNGSGVTTSGYELQASTSFDSFLPVEGFGGNVSYTNMKADDVDLYNQLTGEELEFPSQSEHSYNVSGYWENAKWSMRLAYNYRSEYLLRANDRSGNPVYVEDAGYLDAKIRYTVNKHLKVYADATNLTEEKYVENAGPGRMSNLNYSGRIFSLGMTYKF